MYLTRSTILRVTLGLVAAAVVGAVAVAIPRHNATPGDQEVYALAAERAVRGEQFYRPDQVRAFTYPPFCVLYFTPLVGTTEPVRRSIWYVCNAMLLAAVVIVLVRSMRVMHRADGPPRWVGIVVTTVLAGRFALSPIEYQGHDQIVFLLTLLAIVAWSRSRESAAGFWAGLAAATKATPALLLPVFLWNRQWRAAAVFGIAAVGATFLPDVVVSHADGTPWAVSWYRSFVSKVDVGTTADASGAWTSWDKLNQSLAGTTYRLLTPVANDGYRFDVSLFELGRDNLRWLTVGLQVAVLLLVVATTWRGWTAHVDSRERTVLRLGQGAAVVCGMLLLSPMSSKGHFCVLLLPIAYLVADFLQRRRDPVVGFALGVVLLLGTLTAKDLVGRAIGDELLARGTLTFCTLACLVGVSRVVAVRSRLASSRSAGVPGPTIALGTTADEPHPAALPEHLHVA